MSPRTCFVLLTLTSPQSHHLGGGGFAGGGGADDQETGAWRRFFLCCLRRRQGAEAQKEGTPQSRRVGCGLRAVGYGLLASLDPKCWRLALGPPWLDSPRSPQCSLYFLPGQEKSQRVSGVQKCLNALATRFLFTQ